MLLERSDQLAALSLALAEARSDWMRNAIAAFGWVSPGELRVFEPDELEAAKAWLAESS